VYLRAKAHLPGQARGDARPPAVHVHQSGVRRGVHCSRGGAGGRGGPTSRVKVRPVTRAAAAGAAAAGSSPTSRGATGAAAARAPALDRAPWRRPRATTVGSGI
jgi:hypothetical protein